MSDPSQAQPPTDEVEASSAAGDTPTTNAQSSNDSAPEQEAAAPPPAAEPEAPSTPEEASAPGAAPEPAPSQESQASGQGGPGGADEAAAPSGEAAPAPVPAENAAGSAGQPAAAGAAAEEGAGKKKRRRRRRKKGGAAAEGAEGAQAVGEGAKEKKESAGVFAHLFAGGPRKHAFAAGEVVAGRVTKVDAGVATVDLFGKATAFIDVLEPREVPVLPEPPQEEAAAQAPAAAAAEAGQAAETGAAAADSAPAEASSEQASAAAQPTNSPDEPAGAAPAEEASPPAQPAATAEAAAAQPAGPSEPVAPEAASPEPAPSSEGATAAEAAPAAPAAEGEAAVTDASQAQGGEAAAAPAEATSSDEATSGDAGAGQSSAGEAPASEATTPAAEATVEQDAGTPAAGEAPVATASAETAAGVAGKKAEPAKKAEPVEIVPEFSEPHPELPTLGQILRGRIGSVAESGHIVLVNRVIDKPAAKAQIRACRDAKQRVEGVVYGFNRGGFDVLVRGVRVFCPARSMSLSPITDPEAMLGQKAEFTVSPNKGSGSSLVVGRRGILEREQRKQAKALLKSLEPGQKLTGKVTQVREFGVFVDIGGIEGLVHQSELSHSRGVRPADVAKPGDEVEVQVLKLGGGDGNSRKDRERVSLSIRALQPDPWEAHEDVLRPGAVREAKVVRLTDFGAFMELAPMVEGLLHISELGRDLKHANAVLSEGETIHVVVERVDKKQRRISLSKLTQSELEAVQEGKVPDPEVRLPKPGKTVKVVVDRVEHAGLVVRVPGIFGKRGRGFVPNSEVGTERGTDHRKMFPPGTELDVKVIGTDRDGGLRCSKKALTLDEEKRAVQDYRKEVAKQGLGTFGDLLREKLGSGKSS